ncbi:MAG TPA: hypothetical protein VGO47_10175 [Chlamydiales bacterium]|nr:hypothetical protein [Chlamydiales bacterium]
MGIVRPSYQPSLIGIDWTRFRYGVAVVMGFAYLLEMNERYLSPVGMPYARPGAVLYALHATQVIGITFPPAIFQIIMDAELREESARKEWAYS